MPFWFDCHDMSAIADPESWLRDHLNVSRETLEALKCYETLLVTWQKTHNLVAPSTLEDVWRRHIVDSAQLIRFGDEKRPWLDVGTGAGFPGLVIALCCRDTGPETPPVTLVERNHKKVAFLRTVIRKTGASAQLVFGDMGSYMQEHTGKPGIITARAVAPLVDLCTLSEPLMAKGWRGVYPKGKTVNRELKEARKVFSLDYKLEPSLVDAKSHIVVMENLKRRHTP